jgi:hypothetical protein
MSILNLIIITKTHFSSLTANLPEGLMV